MNTAIIILLVAVGIVALLFVFALFSPKEYSISRDVLIRKPQQQVFDYIRMLRNQDKFSKWVMADPNMKKTFTGTDGQVGFIYAWDGNKDAGKGEQELKKVHEGSGIEIEIRFIRPFAGIAQVTMTTEKVSENETKVRWQMSGRNPVPNNIMNGMIGKMLGKDMESSLDLLRSNLEKKS